MNTYHYQGRLLSPIHFSFSIALKLFLIWTVDAARRPSISCPKPSYRRLSRSFTYLQGKSFSLRSNLVFLLLPLHLVSFPSPRHVFVPHITSTYHRLILINSFLSCLTCSLNSLVSLSNTHPRVCVCGTNMQSGFLLLISPIPI